MEFPQDSRCLEKEDLFHPNKDTKQEFRQKILVVNHPGIGKTVLTEKSCVLERPEFMNCLGEISSYFKFTWFNAIDMKDITLKTFFCNGRQLSNKEFEKIFEEIKKNTQKKQFLFSIA